MALSYIYRELLSVIFILLAAWPFYNAMKVENVPMIMAGGTIISAVGLLWFQENSLIKTEPHRCPDRTGPAIDAHNPLQRLESSSQARTTTWQSDLGVAYTCLVAFPTNSVSHAS
ncbi:hypothetical protein CDD83_4241 [Cordyceps sp. RAO-2017]|nr:hypothetical protein CDD83_4241 [Cordyceps sp. RAO-2017]